MQLEGKHILLTGATRGIGRALAAQLVHQGAKVLAVGRDRAALAALSAELGPSVTTFGCDLALAQEREQLIAAVGKGPLDGLINNAGIQVTADLTFAQKERAFEITRETAINFECPIHLCAALLPVLAARPEALIVNLTSALALTPKASAPVYCATKAGLRSFTTALRYQARSACPQVAVTECVMALVDTDMTRGRGRGKITPERAAYALLDGVRKNRRVIWVGQTRLFGMIHRVAPSLAARIVRGG